MEVKKTLKVKFFFTSLHTKNMFPLVFGAPSFSSSFFTLSLKRALGLRTTVCRLLRRRRSRMNEWDRVEVGKGKKDPTSDHDDGSETTVVQTIFKAPWMQMKMLSWHVKGQIVLFSALFVIKIWMLLNIRNWGKDINDLY